MTQPELALAQAPRDGSRAEARAPEISDDSARPLFGIAGLLELLHDRGGKETYTVSPTVA